MICKKYLDKKTLYILAVMCVITAVVMCVNAQAATWTTCDNYVDGLKWYHKIMYPLVKLKYMALEAVGSAMKPLFSWKLSGIALNYAKAALTATTTLGKAICFLYFLLDLMEHATRDTFTVENFVKSLTKLVLIFIIFEPTNLATLSDFGNSLNNTLIGSMTGSNGSVSADALYTFLTTEYKKMNFIKTALLIFDIQILGTGLVTLVTIIIALLVGIGRIIETGVYLGMLPLGLASIYNGGLNSSGFRYFKKLVALQIQGAIMLLTYYIGVAVNDSLASIIPSSISTIGRVIDLALGIASGLAVIAVLVKSKSISNDIMGV